MKTHLRVLAILLALTAAARSASFQTSQAADVVLGQSTFTTNTPGSGANGLNHPTAAVMDPATGKVFVSDTDNNRVLRFASAAAAQSGASAELVFGQPDFSTTSANQGGSASAGTISIPMDIAVDAQGTLWVADYGNNRVLGFHSAATVDSNNPPADVVLGKSDFTSTTGGVAPDQMNRPYGLAIGPDNTLWVGDTQNNRVLRFANSLILTSGVSANGVLGQPDLSTGSVSGSNPASNTLAAPTGLHADAAGRLWVVDYSNHRILRFDDAVHTATIFGGNASAVIGQPGFTTSSPTSARVAFGGLGVFLDASGALWACDFDFSRVLRFPNAASISAGGAADLVLGQPDFIRFSSGTSARNLSTPFFLHPGPDGSLLVADYGNSRILRFSPAADPVTPPAAPTLAVSGKKTLVTPASKVVLKGATTGEVTSVTATLGRKTFTARGTSSWSLPVPLKPGKNAVLLIAHGSGGDSAPVHVTITRR
jgi:sugar lactone lactonase YvrE